MCSIMYRICPIAASSADLLKRSVAVQCFTMVRLVYSQCGPWLGAVHDDMAANGFRAGPIWWPIHNGTEDEALLATEDSLRRRPFGHCLRLASGHRLLLLPDDHNQTDTPVLFTLQRHAYR